MNAITMHISNGTIEGNGGKYRSPTCGAFPLPLTITLASPKVSPQITGVWTYALHDANLVDDEENKNIKFDDLIVDERSMNMDVDGIFH
jgi:hypothetical protein